MSDEEAKRQQVIQQCKVVVHMAEALIEIHQVHAKAFDAGMGLAILDIVGERSAYIMETLGDILNGMDAIDEDEDAWVVPVFAEAHRLWPPKPSA